MAYFLVIPFAALAVFVLAFMWASIMDLITARRRRKDVFYQLSRDHNVRRRPAAK